MKKLLFGLIVVTLALAIMAPGTPGTPPVKKTPPPVETTEPPPVETQPVETQPVVVTEPPVIATDVGDWPDYVATKPERERKDAALPAGGFGPPAQTAPACASLLLALVALAWKALR